MIETDLKMIETDLQMIETDLKMMLLSFLLTQKCAWKMKSTPLSAKG